MRVISKPSQSDLSTSAQIHLPGAIITGYKILDEITKNSLSGDKVDKSVPESETLGLPFFKISLCCTLSLQMAIILVARDVFIVV
jgi:hypothetical protein